MGSFHERGLFIIDKSVQFWRIATAPQPAGDPHNARSKKPGASQHRAENIALKLADYFFLTA